MKKVSLGILGCGTVGSALVDLISSQGEAIAVNTGIQLEIVKIGVRDSSKQRPDFVQTSLLTTNLDEVLDNPDIEIVVELMGGIDPAKQLLEKAFARSKSVVTANKELLAHHSFELFEAAQSAGVRLAFEASAAGAIPIVRTLKESLLGEPITRITGILNGTTNYILSSMTGQAEETSGEMAGGLSYEAALQRAQELGYAESDPANDISGRDAAAKTAILASIAFGQAIDIDEVYCEGIEGVSPEDILYAGHLGYTLKLLSIAEKLEDGIAARTHLAMVPSSHQLAKVSGGYNAVYVEGKAVGELMLYGHGAGGAPTASAVLGDILDLAQHPKLSFESPQAVSAKVLPISDLKAAYYLRLEVEDNPGVLAEVAAAFGENHVSIRSMEQVMEEGTARLIFITHQALEKDFKATLQGLQKLKAVKEIVTSLRVADLEP